MRGNAFACAAGHQATYFTVEPETAEVKAYPQPPTKGTVLDVRLPVDGSLVVATSKSVALLEEMEITSKQPNPLDMPVEVGGREHVVQPSILKDTSQSCQINSGPVAAKNTHGAPPPLHPILPSSLQGACLSVDVDASGKHVIVGCQDQAVRIYQLKRTAKGAEVEVGAERGRRMVIFDLIVISLMPVVLDFRSEVE